MFVSMDKMMIFLQFTLRKGQRRCHTHNESEDRDGKNGEAERNGKGRKAVVESV
jgi:hypothetical protein